MDVILRNDIVEAVRAGDKVRGRSRRLGTTPPSCDTFVQQLHDAQSVAYLKVTS